MAKRERAELEAADANVRCQRELLKRGVAENQIWIALRKSALNLKRRRINEGRIGELEHSRCVASRAHSASRSDRCSTRWEGTAISEVTGYA